MGENTLPPNKEEVITLPPNKEEVNTLPPNKEEGENSYSLLPQRNHGEWREVKVFCWHTPPNDLTHPLC